MLRILLCSLTLALVPLPQPGNAQNPVAAKNTEEAPVSLSQNDSTGGDKKNILSEAVDAIAGQDPLTLALKNIELTMGENGFEVWRLKAQWASMKESDGSIEVLKPQIVYSMNERNANVTAKASAPSATQPTMQPETQAAGNFSTDPAKASVPPPKSAAPANATTDAPSTKLPQVPDEDDENIILVTADKGVVRQKDKLITLEGNVNAVRGTGRLTGPRMVYDGQARSITFTDGMHFSGEGVTGQASRGGWNLTDNIITADGGVNLIYYAPMPAALKKSNGPAETAPLKNSNDKLEQETDSAVKDQAGKQIEGKTKAHPAKNLKVNKK